MAIYMAIVNGSTLFGSPFVGWIANLFGARWALMVEAAAGLAAAGLGYLRLRSSRKQRERRPTARIENG